MSKIFTLLFLCLSANLVLAAGGLTFTQNKMSVSVAADATDVTVPFTFENKTAQSITIARYDTACACLKTKVANDKMTYEPGEKGEIQLFFDLGRISGKMTKSLMLWTTDDSAASPSSILQVEILIPVLIEISPVTTIWQNGSDLSTKKVTLNVRGTEPIHIKKHLITNSNFSYEFVSIREGWEYEIHVTPKSTDKPVMGIIKLKTDSKISRYQNMMTYMVIKKASQ
ncbi:MAG: DUF1573 domain-containing protein [Akkermansiaceae bacterium]